MNGGVLGDQDESVEQASQLPALEVDRVSFSYGGTKALDDVSLTVPDGRVVGLIGPNGSGKSTLINLVSGAQKGKHQGSIRLFGESVDSQHPSKRAGEGLSRIFQGIRLFDSLTIEQNILLGAQSTFRHSFVGSIIRSPLCRAETKRARQAAAEAMSIFGDRIYPRRQQQVLSLSYANRRRVEIARALMNNPRLLLLDEPTAGMNPHETEELTAQLDSLSQDRGMAMLLVEHKMSVIGDLCRNVFVLDAGVVIAEGSPSYVQTQPRVMEAFLGTA